MQSISSHALRSDHALFGCSKRYTSFRHGRSNFITDNRRRTTRVFNFCRIAFIALRLYAIWDQRKIVRMILYAALAVTYIPMMVLLGFSAIKYYSKPPARLLLAQLN